MSRDIYSEEFDELALLDGSVLSPTSKVVARYVDGLLVSAEFTIHEEDLAEKDKAQQEARFYEGEEWEYVVPVDAILLLRRRLR